MKRKLGLLLALLIVFAMMITMLAACGNGDSDEGKKDDQGSDGDTDGDKDGLGGDKDDSDDGKGDSDDGKDDSDDGKDNAECKHSYSSRITKDPTCTDDGVKTYTCTLCNHSYVEAIKATGHEEVIDN